MAPVGQALVAHRARRLTLAVSAVVLPFPLLSALGVYGSESTDHAALAVLAWIALVALHVATGRARGRWLPLAVVPAVALVTVGLMPVIGEPWYTTAWFLGVAVVLAARGRWRLLGLGVMPAVVVAFTITEPLPALGFYGTITANLWNIAYASVIHLLVIGGLLGAARLAVLVRELEGTHPALIERTIDAERRRLAGDLHDVLGQSLTAIALKGDLARRLLDVDRVAAAAELDDLIVLATAQAAEVDAVTVGEREVSFRTEVEGALALLRTAGVDVSAEVEVVSLDANASELLGWAVREGVTNALRHAVPERMSLSVLRDGDGVRLELRNDGVRGRGAVVSGSGLRNLQARAVGVDGRVTAGVEPGGDFCLRVDLGQVAVA